MKPVNSNTPKTKKIQKRNRQRRNIGSDQIKDQISKNLVLKTPVKRSDSIMDDQKTVKKAYVKMQLSTLTSSLDFYQSCNPYILGQINSISYRTFRSKSDNGRFYNLLKLKKECFEIKKPLKCNCMKSKCQAKYCDCFSNGTGCSSLCGCTDCKNVINNTQPIAHTERFCKCSKSGCVKKYCQCYQRGDACSSKCRCCNCQNIAGQSKLGY